jgi:lysophospholipase L1-like esterase
MRHRISLMVVLAAVLALPAGAWAELPWQFDEHTRYMVMGDSLGAGYGAIPVTQGYAYLLYQEGAFDTMPNTLLTNAAVTGATSQGVLDFQVPQAIQFFRPEVITLTVGGDDLAGLLLRLLNAPSPPSPQEFQAAIQNLLATYGANLYQILSTLKQSLPGVEIYLGNLYEVPEIVEAIPYPGAERIIPAFNQVIARVAAALDIPVADLYSAFLGRRGLLLIERHGAEPFQIHPTNAGYRVMTQAFEAVIQ